VKPLVDLIILVFVVSSVLGVGLSLTVSEIMAPLRRVRLVALSLLANFVVVPAVAVAITKVMSLSEPAAVGLILLGAAAGAPFLPKLVEVAKGDLAFSVALMVLLMIGSLAYLPLVLPLLLPGVSVNSRKIAESLLVTMILPLGVGLCLKALRESLAVRLRPLMGRLSNISLLIALVLISAMNSQRLLEMVSTRAIPAVALFVGVSFGAGYVLGGFDRDARPVLGLGTAARNFPAALLVGGQNFDDPNVAILVLVAALLSLLILVPLARASARRRA
jgi:BASS family bile acid:Na+ symporter